MCDLGNFWGSGEWEEGGPGGAKTGCTARRSSFSLFIYIMCGRPIMKAVTSGGPRRDPRYLCESKSS